MPWLEGKALANTIFLQTKEAVLTLRAAGQQPQLAIIVASDDPQSAWYVRSIAKAAGRCDIQATAITLPTDSTTNDIAKVITEQAADDTVHGIILQTPLPVGVDLDTLLPCIPVAKDVDGASPASAGALSFGLPCFAPATAEAVLALLADTTIKLAGKRIVVVGRSRIVGKPVAQLLLAQDATVTVCHSKSVDLAVLTRQADVLVVAAGRAGLIGPEHVKRGAVVIDVGTNVVGEALIGDVKTSVADHATVTPVPGGVGPVTTALILQHTVTAVTALLPSYMGINGL